MIKPYYAAEAAERYEAELERVVREYRREGSSVVVRPPADSLPPFAAGYRVDLLATGGQGNALVRVVPDRWELKSDPSILALDKLARKQADWRFDIVILGWPPPLPVPDAVLLGQMLAEAEGAPPRAGLLLAWCVAKAALMRLSLRRLGDIGVQLRELYGLGLIEDDEFDRLDAADKLREGLERGDATLTVTADDVRAVADGARRLLAEQEPARAVA